MATGTTNPPGSADAIDLQANAINIDLWAIGSSANAPDRLGVPRKTLFGMQSEFEVTLAGMAYETPVPYAASIVMSRPTQLVQYLGENYKVKTGLIPFTTSGVFATDAPSLVGVGDAVLRQDLLAAGGSARVSFLQSGSGAFARSIESREQESLSVTDFMTNAQRADAASGSPVLDHASAFTAANTQQLVTGGRVFAPKLNYRLDTNVIGVAANVIEIAEGATFIGTGILFGMQRIDNKPSDSRRTRFGATNAGSIQAVDEYVKLTNTGTGPGYGFRQDYFHTGALLSGFSLAQGNIAVWQDVRNGASGQARWTVATSPENATASQQYGIVGEEMNLMNRGPDTGYVKIRGGSTRWVGGIQIVPEADDLAGGTGNICRNIIFSFCTAHSINNNDLGKTVKSYNGLLVERDSIAPSGRGALYSGDTTGNAGDRPYAGVEIDQRWTTGLDVSLGTFDSDVAIKLGATHKITWGTLGTSVNSVSGDIRLDSAVSTNVSVNPGGLRAAQFAYVASAVNFLNMFGNATGAAPAIGSAGTDTNIDLAVAPKGTGVLDYKKAAVAATTPANFTATHMVDFKFNGVAYKIPARVAAW